MELKIPKEDRGNTTSEPPAIRTDADGGSASEFGPLKSLLEAISAVYANREESVAIGNMVEGLLLRVASLDALLETPPIDVADQRYRFEVIYELEGIEGKLRSVSEEQGPQWLIDHAQDVFGLLKSIREEIFHYYRMVREIQIYDQGLKSIDPAGVAILNDFSHAQQAEYRHGDRMGCLKGTRRDILDEIELWTRDFQKPPIYWLNGLIGTGKSAIAQTIAERLFANGRLGASFFCSRNSEDRRNLRSIFPTIAVQLARRYDRFRSIFVPLVQSHPEIAHGSMYVQMNKLVVQPLARAAISTVIVMDALNECEGDEPASAILSVLGQFLDEIPNVKFFVTGRPELHIQNGLRPPLLAKEIDGFVPQEVEPDRALSDERQGPLIPSGNGGCLGRTKLRPIARLDSIYTSILHEAFGNHDPNDDPKVRSVLAAVILAATPLSPSAIAALLVLDSRDVFSLLSSVNPLLILPDIDHPVQPFHKPFSEFIVDPARCPNPRFVVSPLGQHTELLVGCLELMNQRLERDMCKLPDGVINLEVMDLKQRTERYIDEALAYACRSWHKHLIEVTPTPILKIMSVLHQFLEEKFLFWLEVLSVLGATREAFDALEITEKWLDGSRTLELTQDCSRFLHVFFDVINTSAPHIYTSALPLSPRTSIIRELYERYASPLVRVVQGLPAWWDPAIPTVHRGDFEGIATWSSCNRFIAVAGRTTIELLDAATVERLRTFKCRRSTRYRRLGFSPDGHTLTEFTQTEFTSWDTQTGGLVGVIPTGGPITLFHSSFSFAYSVDGSVLAVSNASSRDSTFIAAYDLTSRTHIRSRDVPDGWIVSPMWTQGECLRFVTVEPRSITIWETPFTLAHTPTKIESFPTPNRLVDVMYEHFLFLPAHFLLAITIEDTILVWDALDSRFLLQYGLISSLRAARSHTMSFSFDGRFFSYTASDREIHVWKRSSARYVLHQKLSFAPGLTEPYLSPNGGSIVAAGPSIVLLWRTRDQILFLPDVPIYGRGGFVLGFSPDEVLAASARIGGDMVAILDLQSGGPRLVIDAGMEIRTLAVTGSVVTVAGDGKVVTWNLPAQNCAHARTTVDDSVHTATVDRSGLVFPAEEVMSLCLNRVAIAGLSKTLSPRVRVHDASTGRRLADIKAYNAPEWISLDEREVWCMSLGSSVKGWKVIEDSECGIAEVEPLETTACPPGVFPWQSRRGFEITHDGWVLGPTKKRLLWLPHHWRSEKWFITWSGRFLGLGRNDLPEVVILEFSD